MRVLSLFAGIGGMDLGLERAGMTVVAQCEIDPFCRQVLKKHWPHVKQYDDVRTLSGEQVTREVGPVDMCVGGYPCQPFSTAGERRGAEDDRHLWPEMRRLVEELRPTWVIGENVAGHISMGLDEVLSDLDALGYATRAFVIPAVAVDAPHRRDRVWTVAHSNMRGEHAFPFDAEVAGASQSVSNPVRGGSSGPGRAIEPGNPATNEHRQVDRTQHVLGWPTKPAVRRRDDGVSRKLDRHRLKALGNAVVPQVVELIGRAIMEAQREQD